MRTMDVSKKTYCRRNDVLDRRQEKAILSRRGSFDQTKMPAGFFCVVLGNKRPTKSKMCFSLECGAVIEDETRRETLAE